MTGEILKEEKYCPKCGLIKDISEFHQSKKRNDGVQGYCKECQKQMVHDSECMPLVSTGGPEVPPSSHTGHHHFRENHMMMDEVFDLYYRNPSLSEFVKKKARKYSHNEKDQEDFMQMAWLRISMCPPGYSLDYYEHIAERAIYCEYKKQWRKRKYHLSFLENMDHDEYLMWMTGRLY